MNWWDALLLGIVQGLAEFLPISSSGHLVLFQTFIPGFHQPGVLFDVWLHLATLFAVLFYFHRDLTAIGLSLIPGIRAGSSLEWSRPEAWRLALLLVVATIPAGIVGVALNEQIESLFQTGLIVGLALVVNGFILSLASRYRAGEKRMTGFRIGDAFLVGLAQAVSLAPGISRSGSTIAAGMFRGLRGEEAVKFSFFLSIPAVLGAVLLEGLKEINQVHFADIPSYGIGFVASLFSGLLAINLILRVVRKNQLKVFAYYCWVVGSISVLASLAF